MGFFKGIKERLELVGVGLALFLSPLLYIGVRDTQTIRYEASQGRYSIEEAKKLGITEESIKQLKLDLDTPPKDIVGAARHAVVQAAFTLEQERRAGEAPREIVTETGARVSIEDGVVSAEFQRPDIVSEEDIKEELEAIGFKKEKEIESRRRRAALREKLKERAIELEPPTPEPPAEPTFIQKATAATSILALAALETPGKIVERISTDIFGRPIGRVIADEEKVTRFVTPTGEVIEERVEPVEIGEPVLLPGVAEAAAKIGEVIAAPFRFITEEAPELIERGIEFVRTGEAKERLEQAIDTIRKNPKEAALVAAGLGLSVALATIQDAQDDPIKFITELILIDRGIKGVGKISKAVSKRIKTAKFERVIKKIDEGIKKTPEAEVRARLERGGILTADKKQIQTTFGISPEVITADRAARIRAAALSPERGFVTRVEFKPTPKGIEVRGKRVTIPTGALKVAEPPGRVAVIPTERGAILTLEQVGRFDTRLLRPAAEDFIALRKRLGILPEVRFITPQRRLIPEVAKVIDRRYRRIPPEPKFITRVRKELPVEVEPTITIDRAALARQQALEQQLRKYPFVQPPPEYKPRNIFEEIREATKLRRMEATRAAAVEGVSTLGLNAAGVASTGLILGVSRIQPLTQQQLLLQPQIITPIAATDILTGQIAEVTPISITEQEQRQLLIQQQLQRQLTLQEEILLERLTPELIRPGEEVRPTPPPRPRVTRPIPITLGLPEPKFIATEKEKKLKNIAYDVLLREGEARGDRFRKIAEGLPENRALQFGSTAADQHLEATFLIKKTKKVSKIRDLLSRPDLSKFRSPVPGSKIDKNALIEKMQFRLDHIQEVRQISFFKAQAAERKRQQITFLVSQKQTKARKQQQINILKRKKAQQISFIKSNIKQQKQKQFNFLVAQKKKGGSSKFIV